MAYTETATRYNISLNVGDDVWAQSLAAEFSGVNMTDQLAVAFAQSWLDLPWPAGTNVSVSVSKRESSDTTLTADMATGIFS